MTKTELQGVLELAADALELASDHFPAALVDSVLLSLAGASDPADVKLREVLEGSRRVFGSQQGNELAAFFRGLENRRLILKLILRRINRP
jgi:hypothetical protein